MAVSRPTEEPDLLMVQARALIAEGESLVQQTQMCVDQMAEVLGAWATLAGDDKERPGGYGS